jgi:hypothetical protein
LILGRELPEALGLEGLLGLRAPLVAQGRSNRARSTELIEESQAAQDLN